MNWKWPTLLVSVAVAIGVAYALEATSIQEVDGRRYDVPRDRIFDARIPWLPAPSNGSFTYLLDRAPNPNAIPPHRVLVQARQDVCGDGQAQMLRVACEKEEVSFSAKGLYTKFYPIADYSYAWNYYVENQFSANGGEHKQLQVAYCSPISPNPARPKGTAICTSVWSVDGLVLTLGFEERELPELRSMRDRAATMLLSWKVE